MVESRRKKLGKSYRRMRWEYDIVSWFRVQIMKEIKEIYGKKSMKDR